MPDDFYIKGPGRNTGNAEDDWESAGFDTTYLVVAANLTFLGPHVLAWFPIVEGAINTDFPLFKVKGRKADRLKDGSRFWIVTIHWEATTKEREEDPTDNTPTLNVVWEDREIPVEGLFTNDRVPQSNLRNSAGENIEAKTFGTTCTLTITKNYPNTYEFFDALLSYQNTINEDTFLGITPHNARITGVSPATVNQGDDTYLRVIFTIKVLPDPGWDVQPLDIGTFYLDDNNNRKHFLTQDGQPCKGLLDGSGKPLNGTGTGIGAGLPAVYLPRTQVLTSAVFSDLGIPNDIGDYIIV